MVFNTIYWIAAAAIAFTYLGLFSVANNAKSGAQQTAGPAASLNNNNNGRDFAFWVFSFQNQLKKKHFTKLVEAFASPET